MPSTSSPSTSMVLCIGPVAGRNACTNMRLVEPVRTSSVKTRPVSVRSPASPVRKMLSGGVCDVDGHADRFVGGATDEMQRHRREPFAHHGQREAVEGEFPAMDVLRVDPEDGLEVGLGEAQSRGPDRGTGGQRSPPTSPAVGREFHSSWYPSSLRKPPRSTGARRSSTSGIPMNYQLDRRSSHRCRSSVDQGEGPALRLHPARAPLLAGRERRVAHLLRERLRSLRERPGAGGGSGEGDIGGGLILRGSGNDFARRRCRPQSDEMTRSQEGESMGVDGARQYSPSWNREYGLPVVALVVPKSRCAARDPTTEARSERDDSATRRSRRDRPRTASPLRRKSR